MIRSSLIILFFFAVVSSRAQTVRDDTQVLSVGNPIHDFGSIPQGKPVTYPYVLVNHTKDTVRMQQVEASCGCTTPHWSKASILPGDSTILPITYNAAGAGGFQKSVTIFYTNNLRQVIYIKGDVWKTPDTSVPLNTGIQLVKQ